MKIICAHFSKQIKDCRAIFVFFEKMTQKCVQKEMSKFVITKHERQTRLFAFNEEQDRKCGA